jgi:hypothetical protein
MIETKRQAMEDEGPATFFIYALDGRLIAMSQTKEAHEVARWLLVGELEKREGGACGGVVSRQKRCRSCGFVASHCGDCGRELVPGSILRSSIAVDCAACTTILDYCQACGGVLEPVDEIGGASVMPRLVEARLLVDQLGRCAERLYRIRQRIEKLSATDDSDVPERRVLDTSAANALAEVATTLRGLQYATERARIAVSPK